LADLKGAEGFVHKATAVCVRYWLGRQTAAALAG